jgi:D-threonate/D-erythronate kinase
LLAKQLLAIADDLTGALETGAKLAAQGIDCAVSVNGRLPDTRALVVNAGTRHLPAGAAALKIRSIVDELSARGPVPDVFLKTDSTLRGPIAESIEALLKAFPDRKVVYAPAYPALGRTVCNSILLVDGVPLAHTEFARDFRTPVTESSVVLIAGPASGCSPGNVGQLLARGDSRILVSDGTEDEHLEQVARHIHTASIPIVAAGTAAFAGVWARGLTFPRQDPPRLPGVHSGLIVVGSRHSRSRTQAQRAWALGIASFTTRSEPDRIAETLRQRCWAVLTTPSAPAADAVDTARKCGRLVHDVLQLSAPGSLIIFGGDTAFAILEALGCTVAQPYGDLLPGVPVARVRSNRDYVLVTKAGGFGSEDIILDIMHELEYRQ